MTTWRVNIERRQVEFLDGDKVTSTRPATDQEVELAEHAARWRELAELWRLLFEHQAIERPVAVSDSES